MKLSQATEADKIKALAELDGLVYLKSEFNDYYQLVKNGGWSGRANYTESYDAIIPLIQKLPNIIKEQVLCGMLDMIGHELESKVTIMDLIRMLDLTPSQLCDAVLIATGKYEP